MTLTLTQPLQSPRPLKFEDIRDLVADDIAGVDDLTREYLESEVSTVSEIGRYIVEAGGKRLRPTIALLVARMLDFSHSDAVKLATIIEFLHTATLLHDDVVDNSTRRRNKKTVNTLWGNAPSVLVGDFLYSRAFQLMTDLNRHSVIRIIANATNRIAEGEVRQLENIGNADLLESEYIDIIRGKSALLFQASAETGAALASEDERTKEAARLFGLHFGLAYQLIDDFLDYAGDSNRLGKNVGDDLAEGKPTLPMVFALRHASARDSSLLRDAIQNRRCDNVEQVIEIVRRTGALGYTQTNALAQSNLAKTALYRLPPNRYRDGLENLTDLALDRVQ